MTRDQILTQARRLDLSEQVLLVADLWDGIAAENDNMPMPNWQKHELDQRRDACEQGRLRLHEWTSVHEELRNQYEQEYP